jgi:16S rRNA G966 N2-methylase RsmD
LPDTLGGSVERPCFDLCVLDPPYEFDTATISAILTGVQAYLGNGGLIVLERARRAAPVEVTGLVSRRCVTSGDSVLYFYG